ncbi:MAG: hypothetical protein JXA33_02880 [Anaerolineae bacterium]|nr:hypothetical protein [Anaerolineae bacterium]
MQDEIPTFTFDQVLEVVSGWSFEQQEILFDVLRQRQIALRRQEIAKNVHEAVTAYHHGELQPESTQDAIAHLRVLLAEET